MKNLILFFAMLFIGADLSQLCFADETASQATVKLYTTKCATCHAANGSGDTKMGKKLGSRDFRSEEVQKQKDEELIHITAHGKGKMPGFEKSLKEQQIKELVSYIRELSKKKS